MTDPFRKERAAAIAGYETDEALKLASATFRDESIRARYSYNFDWLGRPIIQYPQDMVAVQELIWATRPDLIIETGIARGGSLMLSASMLALLDYCDAAAEMGPNEPVLVEQRRRVLAVDIDIREHNRAGIEAHPLSSRIEMIQGSSIDPAVVEQVHAVARDYHRILVMLDSNHTHEHVLAELHGYAPLTSSGSYCVVFDTIIEDLPEGSFPDRPWDRGDNAKTAVFAYLEELAQGESVGVDGRPLAFAIDRTIDAKLQLSAAPEGYLRRL